MLYPCRRKHVNTHSIDAHDVINRNTKIRPLPEASHLTKFSISNLAHSVIKADYANWTPRKKYSCLRRMEELAMTMIYTTMFFPCSCELRLRQGKSHAYADFTQTSYSGRTGQGLAILRLTERYGGGYVGRFDKVVQCDVSGGTSPRTGPSRSPDFVFDTGNNTWVIAEAKGAFVKPGGKPNFKRPLREALQQVRCGIQRIKGRKCEGCAIGSWIREIKDGTHEGTVLLEVDYPPHGLPSSGGSGKPPHGGEKGDEAVEPPAYAVRGANYASWLRAMQLFGPAERLLGRHAEEEDHSLYLVNLKGRDLIFRYIHPDFERGFRAVGFVMRRRRWWCVIPVIGMFKDTFDVVRTAIQKRSPDLLSELRPREMGAMEYEFRGGWIGGSVFPDDTFFGAVWVHPLRELPAEPFHIRL